MIEKGPHRSKKDKMCCDLVGSVGSREYWLWDIAWKRNAFILFSIVLRIFSCYNFGTTGPIQAGFSAKCTSPNEDFNEVENSKCRMFNFRLILLDCITNYPTSVVLFPIIHLHNASHLGSSHSMGVIDLHLAALLDMYCIHFNS